MPHYLLGIDVGTSAAKAVLFDETGSAVAWADSPYAVTYPQPGWAEQSPDVWWKGVCDALCVMFTKSDITPRDIAGIGVAGQSWSAVALDRSGAVLCPTPIWTDTRSKAECRQMVERVGEDTLFSLSGNPVQPTYTLPKVLWYKNHLPSVYHKMDKVLQSNSFIAYRLTGRITQDLSQGYGFSCFNMASGVWDRNVCRALGVSPDLLPEILPCHAVIGFVTDGAAAVTGLAPGTPVVAGGLDAACGTLGAGVVEAGQAQEQGGQAGGMSICVEKPQADRRLILSFHVAPSQWLLQGGTVGGGGVIRWMRTAIAGNLSFEGMDESAARVLPGSEGVLFLPYMAGERSPIWDPYAKGVFYGLDFSKNTSHLIRAALEGTAYALRHNLEAAREAGANPNSLRAMGGAANSLLWTQIKADVTGKRIEVPSSDAATALGAALLAGIGVGLYPDFKDAVTKTIHVQRVHEPNPKPVYEKGYRDYRALYENLKAMMREK